MRRWPPSLRHFPVHFPENSACQHTNSRHNYRRRKKTEDIRGLRSSRISSMDTAAPVISAGIAFGLSFLDRIPASSPPAILPDAITPCAYPYRRLAVFMENPRCCVMITGTPINTREDRNRFCNAYANEIFHSTGCL